MPGWVRILFIALGLAVAGASAATLVWARQRTDAAQAWLQVEGRVLATGIEQRRETRDRDERERRDGSGRRSTETVVTYWPRVSYSYAAGGRALHGDSIWLTADRGFNSPGEAQAFLAAYPPGAAVTVFYDPADPADAALIIDPTPWWMLIFVVLGLAFAAGAFFLTRREPFEATAARRRGDVKRLFGAAKRRPEMPREP